jgi:hypothetical protein
MFLEWTFKLVKLALMLCVDHASVRLSMTLTVDM